MSTDPLNDCFRATFTNGAVLVGVFNYGPLQDRNDPGWSQRLTRLVESEGITHAIIMTETHPRCWFLG
jgi:hypothetical protein